MNESINCNVLWILLSVQFAKIFILIECNLSIFLSIDWICSFDARKRMRKFANLVCRKFSLNEIDYSRLFWLNHMHSSYFHLWTYKLWKLCCFLIVQFSFFVFLATAHTLHHCATVRRIFLFSLQNTRLTFDLMPKGIQSENKTKWNVCRKIKLIFI